MNRADKLYSVLKDGRTYCEVDESAGLRDQVRQTTVFGEVEAVDPPDSVLVYCGDTLTRATRDGDRFVCSCGHVVGVVW